MLEKIKVIGFDADDTLWVNEPFYRQSEMEFAEMLSDYGDEEYINNEFLMFQRLLNNTIKLHENQQSAGIAPFQEIGAQ